MKRLFSAAAMVALLCGCHSITMSTPAGPAKVKSFGQRTSISELSYDKAGVLKVKGYNNDQATGMVEMFKAGIEAGKKGAMP